MSCGFPPHAYIGPTIGALSPPRNVAQPEVSVATTKSRNPSPSMSSTATAVGVSSGNSVVLLAPKLRVPAPRTTTVVAFVASR